jgi:AraC family transcriptional regulator
MSGADMLLSFVDSLASNLDDHDATGADLAARVYHGGMIAHVLTFAAYRRTLIVGRLDAYGITDLGWGDPLKWVAEPAS